MAAIWDAVGVGVAVITALAGLARYLGGKIDAWRDETAGTVGKLATIVADWMDETDDHLAAQDQARVAEGVRVSRIEDHLRLDRPARAPEVRRSRARRRRLDVAAVGLQVGPDLDKRGYGAAEDAS